MDRERGLTLTEVIVISVVCLILAVVLWPVYASPSRPHKTMCLSRVKQMGLSIALYGADNNDRFPPSAAWMDEIEHYIPGASIFHDVEAEPPVAFGYAFRARASSLAASQLQDQAKFLLLFDSTLPEKNASSEPWSLPVPGRHSNADVICFADFHAKGFSTTSNESASSALTPLQMALRADDSAGPK